MAYGTYTPFFKDRIVEFPGRIKLTNVADGTEATYDVEREEGVITEPGTLLNANNMDYGTRLGNIMIDETAGSGTADAVIISALTALGWNEDCLEE